MAGMVTEAATVVTLIGVTGATRNRPAKEQSCRRQPGRRLMRATVTPPLQKDADVIATAADLKRLIRRTETRGE